MRSRQVTQAVISPMGRHKGNMPRESSAVVTNPHSVMSNPKRLTNKWVLIRASNIRVSVVCGAHVALGTGTAW